ncbi:uncharacterized protein L201_007180 [Kwoniella dendrophila CBS 6074]|uniref:Uncharacterized protein n=1 Tax=Kwoniella dendrophila CBS 6074 TaxID=1295534 RepID=A0AAX4K3Q9_9TREE
MSPSATMFIPKINTTNLSPIMFPPTPSSIITNIVPSPQREKEDELTWDDLKRNGDLLGVQGWSDISKTNHNRYKRIMSPTSNTGHTDSSRTSSNKEGILEISVDIGMRGYKWDGLF